MHSGLPVEKVTINPTESTRRLEIPKPIPQHLLRTQAIKKTETPEANPLSH